MIFIRLLLSVAVILNCSAAFSAETYILPQIPPMPTMSNVLPWEKQILIGDGLTPGTRMWVQNMSGNIWHYGTTQSVGDGTGMYVYATAGSPTGFLCAYDTGVVRQEKDGKIVRDDYREFKGISLWIKGDGSDAEAVISTGYSGSANKFHIPLKNDRWHKVFIPWEKWEKPVAGPFWFLAFGLGRKDDTKPTWYIIDRVRLYKEVKIEEIHPTPDLDPPGLIPAKAFVAGRQNISKVIEKLQNKKPVKIVVAGDSIAGGGQLWYTQKAGGTTDGATRYAFFEVFGRILQKFYGYPAVSLPFCTYDNKKKEWAEKPVSRAVADLMVLAVAVGGGSAQDGLAHVDQVLNEKPDLVVWEYGCNDVTYKDKASFLKSTAAAIDKLRSAGIEVVVQTITPGSDLNLKTWMENSNPMQKGATYNVELRKIAAAKGCALADMEGAFLSRGAQFMGDLYADYVHPNHMGHEMMADVLDALITNRDVRIWKHGPVAERKLVTNERRKP